MSTLREKLSHIVGQAFVDQGLDVKFGQVVISERPDLGQFQCNGALGAAKAAGKSPQEIAEAVRSVLICDQEIFQDVTIAGHGFLNIVLTNEYLAAEVEELLVDPRFSVAKLPQKKVIIDYAGPNVAKPLHVGHLRSSIIGNSLVRLYRFMGSEVYGDIHLGDWGTPMGMLIHALSLKQSALPYFDATFTGPYPENSPVTIDDLEVLYPEAATDFKNDPEFKAASQKATSELQSGRPGYLALWKHFVGVSVQAAKENFDKLGILFDWWYGESHYHDRILPIIENLKERGLAVESEGALIIPLQPINGKEVPPLILQKSDDAYLYSTTDIATIDERIKDDHADLILYVVDQRQSLHLAQVFQAAKQIGLLTDKTSVKHLGFGTMNGKDGRPFKTRAGGVLKLKDLIAMVQEKALERMKQVGIGEEYPEAEQQYIAEKVGIAALKFADLINNRLSDYIFDLDRFVSFEGKTGPYLIYTAVRIQSIFRKLEQPVNTFGPIVPPTDIERPLILIMAELPEVITEMLEQNAPHHLAEYSFKLAQEYNRFYQNTSILKETDTGLRNTWIALSHLCLEELRLCLDLLGIEIPERM